MKVVAQEYPIHIAFRVHGEPYRSTGEDIDSGNTRPFDVVELSAGQSWEAPKGVDVLQILEMVPAESTYDEQAEIDQYQRAGGGE